MNRGNTSMVDFSHAHGSRSNRSAVASSAVLDPSRNFVELPLVNSLHKGSFLVGILCFVAKSSFRAGINFAQEEDYHRTLMSLFKGKVLFSQRQLFVLERLLTLPFSILQRNLSSPSDFILVNH